MSERIITIRDIKTGQVLASAEKGNGVRLFEGAWYFEPGSVDMTHLVVTERTYICSYKGICYWIDLAAPEHKARDVAFTYFEVNPGYEFVKDRIAFYAGRHAATMEE